MAGRVLLPFNAITPADLHGAYGAYGAGETVTAIAVRSGLLQHAVDHALPDPRIQNPEEPDAHEK